jgi:hypothetical protein
LKFKYPNLVFHVLNIEHGNVNQDNDAITNVNFMSDLPATDSCDQKLDSALVLKDQEQLVPLLRASLRGISVAF